MAWTGSVSKVSHRGDVLLLYSIFIVNSFPWRAENGLQVFSVEYLVHHVIGATLLHRTGALFGK